MFNLSFAMPNPNLPVHNLSEQEFNSQFKKKHLDKRVLTIEDLKAIEVLFGLDNRSVDSNVGGVSCCEYHAHSYPCNFYHSPEAGVVDRLVGEINRYRAKLLEVSNSAKESLLNSSQ